MEEIEKNEEKARMSAKFSFENIKETLEKYHTNEEGEYDEDYTNEDVLEEILEMPLEVSVRSGWQSIGEELKPEEYLILLTTGGPAVRIVGDLDSYGCPSRARIQYQDWGTPWKEYVMSHEEYSVLEEFARIVIPC